MICLYKIFSNKALYQHSARLDVKGVCEKCTEVEVALVKGADIIGKWCGKSDKNGVFSVEIETPAASYDEYNITVSSQGESAEISGILFGELWIAGGQSNMEMSNVQQPEREDVMKMIQGKKIRGFNQPRLPADGDYSFEPMCDVEGVWRAPEDEGFVNLSAIATKFSNQIYDFLAEKGEECPVGFLNLNRGGTNIETWIPGEWFLKNERIANRAPNSETWNTKEGGNFAQPSAHYNRHVASVIGVRARGMLWYQGESNVGMENSSHVYKDCLIAVHDSYKKLFAVSDVFPIISVHIYPWKYSDHADTKMGYINNAFTDLARRFPEEYPFVPICDLPPIWCKWAGNHPIHPIHKYRIADRLALLVENKYYGRKVKNLQTLPPMLKSCTRHGNKLRLTFENAGSGLYINGGRARGLYLRSKNGAYTPAYCEIVARNVMNVYHPYIDKPCHAAYAVSSLEAKTNLFAGEFPVAPFCTEFVDGVDNTVKIGKKPWLNNENDSEFEGTLYDTRFDFFNRAIFNPSCGSAVCYDSNFAVTARSLRVYALDMSSKKFGSYILASQYSPLDFENYSAMKFALYHHNDLKVELVLYYKESEGTSQIHKVKAQAAENGVNGWYEYSVDLSAIPEGVIEKAEFSFTCGDSRLPYVFLDDIVLVPKG